MSSTTHDTDVQPMIDERKLALRWQMSTRTLQRWRSEGYGPAFLMIGGSIRYRLGDILEYEERQRHGGGA